MFHLETKNKVAVIDVLSTFIKSGDDCHSIEIIFTDNFNAPPTLITKIVNELLTSDST